MYVYMIRLSHCTLKNVYVLNYRLLREKKTTSICYVNKHNNGTMSSFSNRIIKSSGVFLYNSYDRRVHAFNDCRDDQQVDVVVPVDT